MMKINCADLLSDDPKVKYPCSKKITALARRNPSKLYPELELFVQLLDHDNRILRWTAMDVIGALARVDKDRAVDKLISRLTEQLNKGNMITAHHAITALTDIILAKSEYQAEITVELLKVEHYNYETIECRNISIGKVIMSIGRYFDKLEDKRATIEFVRRQTRNTHDATSKKAERFLIGNKMKNGVTRVGYRSKQIAERCWSGLSGAPGERV